MNLSLEECMERCERFEKMLSPCTLCPRNCQADRIWGESGFCGAGIHAEIASSQPHFGEETVLVGKYGSGTVFFYRCNLGCVFCQNETISHGSGPAVSTRHLTESFLNIQTLGCHNLNLVTPTPHLPAIARALAAARLDGFHLPVVYNCGGYETTDVIDLLNGIVDIYMPDIKSLDSGWTGRYLKAEDYPEFAVKSLRRMMDLTGNLQLDTYGVAVKGVMIRHLVMPGMVRDSFRIIDAVKDICGTDAYLNIMPQYRPCFQAGVFPEIDRRILSTEWEQVVEYAVSKQMVRGLEPHSFL